MKDQFKHVLVLQLVLVIYSILGISSKLAAKEEFLSIRFFVFYGVVILNLFFYAIVWQQMLKRLPLVTAYANKAVTIIWAIIWGYVFFGEEITVKKIVGGIIIIIGVVVVVTSDTNKKVSMD